MALRPIESADVRILFLYPHTAYVGFIRDGYRSLRNRSDGRANDLCQQIVCYECFCLLELSGARRADKPLS